MSKTYNLLASPTGEQPTTYNLSKGFTLIELMVVVAIIGLLAGAIAVNFSYAQKKSRDNRRIADLQNFSLALESFKTKNRYYPANSNTSGSIISTSPNWSLPELAPNYIQVLPKDPTNNSPYYYQYKTDSASEATAYELNATLEQDTDSMANDVVDGDDDRYEVGSGTEWWNLIL